MEGGVGIQIHSGLTSEPLFFILSVQEVSTLWRPGFLRKPTRGAGRRGLQERMTGTDTKGCSRLLASGNPPREDREAWPFVMLPTDERAKESGNQG